MPVTTTRLVLFRQASAHLAEETLSASLSVPRGMLVAICASAVVGLWLTVLLLLYVPAAILSATTSSTDSPTILGQFGVAFAIFEAAAGDSAQWAGALTGLIAVAIFTSGAALAAVASRIVFAMARDGALPFSAQLRRLHPRSDAPFIAAAVV